MPADQLLATLLRALQQRHYAPEGSARLLSSATSLLLALSNPLNITLLTSQLLTAPAIWDGPDGLQTCVQVLRCFHGAASSLAHAQPHARPRRTQHGAAPGRGSSVVDDDHHHHLLQRRQQPQPAAVAVSHHGPTMLVDEWVRAVVRGAHAKSPRWRHLLPIAGLLLGLDEGGSSGDDDDDAHAHTSRGRRGGVRRDLMNALVRALDLAIDENRDGKDDALPRLCIVMVANYTMEKLSDIQFADIDHEGLLPMAVHAAFFSDEGFRSGYFLGPIDADVVQSGRNMFTWSTKSSTYIRLEQMASRPLISSMGPLSRLIGRCLEHVHEPSLVYKALEDMAFFARTLATQWRQNKLSEIDASEEATFIDADALKSTVPRLWDVLKACMFTCVNILKVVMARTVADPSLAADTYAPFLAMQTLHTLRHLLFVSNRLGGPTSFSTSVFVTLSAIDILTQYPDHAVLFLQDIKPRVLGQIPPHPLDRTLDLFFLDTAEHFPLLVALHAPALAEDLLIAAATPYLNPGGGMNPNLIQIFEAAHSLMLAVLAVPQNAELTMRTLPSYIDVLLQALPQNLSPRQFRLAFKTLVRIASPPSPLAASQPDLPDILLEILRHRVMQPPPTPQTPLRPQPTSSPVRRRVAIQSHSSALSPSMPPSSPMRATTIIPPLPPPPPPVQRAVAAPPRPPSQGPSSLSTSEKAVLVLAIIDCLPYLSLDLLEEWLPLTAMVVHSIDDNDSTMATAYSRPAHGPEEKEQPVPLTAHGCRERLWEVLSGGEMDVERSQLCVAWWSTRGGREMTLYGDHDLSDLDPPVDARVS